jgi:prepilin-type N-terminal cleavage/methylation domain-containing protein
MPQFARRCRVGFTLIELLVVISLIALLIGILLPALAAARNSARISACLSNVHQLAIGVHTYAADNRDAIPRGLDAVSLVPMNWGEMNVPENAFASSSIWRGDSPAGFGITDYNSHGELLNNNYISDKRSMFCPDDNTNDPTAELAKIGVLGTPLMPYTGAPGEQPYAYSSYVYRNLDQTTNDKASDLGRNALGRNAVALIFDSNSTGDPLASPGTIRTNHRNEVLNFGYTDGHGQTLSNKNLTYSLNPMDYLSWYGGIEAAYNRMLQNADEKNPG